MLVEKRCAFCGKEVKGGEGILFVANDGTVKRFCSSKCRKSALKLKRDPRKLKWTLFYGKKELSVKK